MRKGQGSTGGETRDVLAKTDFPIRWHLRAEAAGERALGVGGGGEYPSMGMNSCRRVLLRDTAGR